MDKMPGIGRTQQEREVFPALTAIMPIDLVSLTTSAATIFTAETDADFQIRHLRAVNVTAMPATITAYIVDSGDSPSASNTIAFQVIVAANSWLDVFTEDTIGFIPPSATLQALSGTANAINLHGFGVEYRGHRET